MIVFLLYLLATILIYFKVFIRRGIVVGGDWGLPSTPVQMTELIKNSWYTWTNQGNLLGDSQYFHNNLPYIIYTWIFRLAKIPPELYVKSFLLLPLTFLGCCFYKFLRYLKLEPAIAFIGGLIYMTAPVFFDLSIIGWIYVIFAMAMLPLSLVSLFKSVEVGSKREAIKAGLYFVLGMLQAQSIVWFPMFYAVSFFYLVKDRSSLRRYFRALTIILLVLFSSLAMLWLPLFFGGGSDLSLKLGLSRISLGTWERLNYVNILRNWGGLFNYQFETAYFSNLTLFSFSLPIMATTSLVFVKNKRLQLFIWLPVIFFIFLFTLGPAWISRLPLSDVFRDISRFSVLASFSYALASSLLLHHLWQNRARTILKTLGFIFFLSWLISIHPYIFGLIAETPKIKDYDMRLRTYSFPPSYLAVDSLLAKEPYSKAVHIPWDILVSSKSDPRFHGYYSEMANVFATYSTLPGLLPEGDKNNSAPSIAAQDLIKALDPPDAKKLKSEMIKLGAGWVIGRNDIESSSKINLPNLYSILDHDSEFQRYYSSPEVTVYRLAKTPPIFLPLDLPDRAFVSSKISPTEYQLKLSAVTGRLDIVLLESYHPGWQLHQKNAWKTPINIKQNPIFNYANHWQVDIDKLCLPAKPDCIPRGDGTYDLKLIAAFQPQKLFLIGLFVSLGSLVLWLLSIFHQHEP